MQVFQRWKKTALHNKALVLTGVLVAVGTLFYTGAAIFQYCLMKQTAKENSEQTDKIIAEAKNITAAAEGSLEQSKRALDASIETSRRDQRAWVGPIDIIHPSHKDGSRTVFVKEGDRPTFGVIVTNSGKTPALKVTPLQRMVVSFTKEPLIIRYNQPRTKPSIGVLQPNAKLLLETDKTEPFTKEIISRLESGQVTLYVFGIITYEDIFKRSHKTTFCMYMSSDLSSMKICETYNDAD